MLHALLPPPQYRRNYSLMGLDISLFVLALSFASTYGLLPLFVSHLSPSTMAVGAIPALRAVGMLPPIFVAGLTERLHRKQPFVLAMTIFERVPYLVLAIATPLLAMDHPLILFWLFCAMLALTTFAAGVAVPAWLDLIAKMIPISWRGRFFGHATALGGLLGIAGSAGAAALLEQYDWIIGVAICFGLAFVFLAFSFICLAFAREPLEDAPPDPMRADTAWRRLPAILHHDRNLRNYLIALLLVTAASPTTAFYIVDARRSLALSDGVAGLYATVLMASSTVGNLLWGYLGDRLGHKWVVVAGAICTGLAPLLAVITRTPGNGALGYGLVFLLAGLATSALQLTALTFIIDLAPADQRPTYYGLANAAQAPIAIAAPLLGAVLADSYGYVALFVLTALLSLLGALIVTQGVSNQGQTEIAVVAEAL